jgi:acetyl-CoA/propionyl-CoA carboxylase biotin carboxyl carrier protein
MKMEHTVTAPVAGVLTELTVKAGQQVRMDETLAVVVAPAADTAAPSGKTAGQPAEGS